MSVGCVALPVETVAVLKSCGEIVFFLQLG